MSTAPKFLSVEPVLPSLDISRDVKWYQEKAGFEPVSWDKMYAVLKRGSFSIHLQWHADTDADPLLGGSVVKLFVEDIDPLFAEFVKRGTVGEDTLRRNTAWNTHEFGFYDLNKNAIFVVQNI